MSTAPKRFSAPPAMQIDGSKKYTATIDTSLGTMKAELYVADAPMTVNNFVFLARQGFYDGVTFHRVIPNFMAQTGDPTGTGTDGPGYRFNDEPVTRNYDRGTLAMANSGPNTNGSQFFITVGATPHLDNRHSVFGEIVEGYDVVEKISKVPRDSSDRPKKEVQMRSVKIERS